MFGNHDIYRSGEALQEDVNEQFGTLQRIHDPPKFLLRSSLHRFCLAADQKWRRMDFRFGDEISARLGQYCLASHFDWHQFLLHARIAD